jgi:hypothetical protein
MGAMTYQRYQDSPDGLWRFFVRLRADGSPVLFSDSLEFRQHDWPFPGFSPLGQETCDSVLSPDGYASYQYESFPPWQPPYTAQGGNGGDIIVVGPDGYARAVATMDGGHPGLLYYFVGPDVGLPSDGRIGGWVISGPGVATGNWQSIVAYLQQSDSDPYHPIGTLSPSYTRYLIDTIAVPFLPTAERQIETLVSEHYETDNPSTSNEMERFHYGAGWGKLRWEFWSTTAPLSPYVFNRAPAIAYGYPSQPLNPSMRLCDVRHYCNIVPEGGRIYLPPIKTFIESVGITIGDFGWPPDFILP